MQIDPITRASVSGDHLQGIIRQKLGPALVGETVATAVIAMLAYSILLLKNDITPEQLKQCVTGASTWILTFLVDATPVDMALMKDRAEMEELPFEFDLETMEDPIIPMDSKKVH